MDSEPSKAGLANMIAGIIGDGCVAKIYLHCIAKLTVATCFVLVTFMVLQCLNLDGWVV
jgi:hypothetical protein